MIKHTGSVRQEHPQGDTPGGLSINRFAGLVIVSLQDLKVLDREFRDVFGDGFGVVDGNLALLDELETRNLSICKYAVPFPSGCRSTYRCYQLGHGEEVKG